MKIEVMDSKNYWGNDRRISEIAQVCNEDPKSS
jgi:hypothetical protein